MDDSFEIPVTFKGEDLSFPAKVVPSGYVYKILVEIYGEPVYFEPDEEGEYRALTDPSLLTKDSSISTDLLKEISLVIQSVRS